MRLRKRNRWQAWNWTCRQRLAPEGGFAQSKTKSLYVDLVVVATGGSILLENYVRKSSQNDLTTSAVQVVPGVTTVTNRVSVCAEGL